MSPFEPEYSNSKLSIPSLSLRCTGISFARIALALKSHNYLEAAACGFTVHLHLVISY